MGVLLRAKREGHIEKMKPIVDRLIADGLFISPTVKEYVLSQVGEQ
jgi:predicted nucleic acid-binding protein